MVKSSRFTGDVMAKHCPLPQRSWTGWSSSTASVQNASHPNGPFSCKEVPMTTATPVYTPTLSGREEIAEGTMAFHITKPADFQFRAGQAIDLTLIDPPETDAEGNTRAFSLSSAPFENELVIATRMRDTAFKRVLRRAPLGMSFKVEGPSGSFVLHRK